MVDTHLASGGAQGSTAPRCVTLGNVTGVRKAPVIGSVRHAALAAIAAAALIFCTPAGSLAQGKPYRTIILFGDTQYIVRSDQQPAGLEAFEDMIDWVIANVDAENIDLVAQLGDATDQLFANNPPDEETLQQWANFNSQWKRLDGIVPYAIVRGNHDACGTERRNG